MTFEEAKIKLIQIMGRDLLSFEGIKTPNFLGEYEFMVLTTDYIRQKICISENKILYKMPEDFLHD